MPKIQMLAHITGGRADGTVWPAAGDPLKVSDAEAHDLYVAQLARPWPGGDEDEQTATAVEASVPPVQSPPDEPAQVGYDPGPEPAPVEAQPGSTPETEPAVAAEREDFSPPRPAASKAEWANWSRKNGAGVEWTESATKQQMMEQYGGRA